VNEKNKWTPYILILPAFIFIMSLLIIYPFGYNVYLSLWNYSMLTNQRWFVGFGNFAGLFQRPDFINSLKVSGIFTSATLAIETFLGLGIALLLHQEFKGRTIARVLLILPLGTIPVINGYIFNILYFPNASVITYILNFLGIVHGHPGWLQNPLLARIAIISLDVWQWTPFMVIILLAGLTGIPDSYYELGQLDNLSKFKMFWCITLPKIKFPLTLAILLRMMDLLKFFDGVFSLTSGGPQSATETVSYYIYRTGFKTFNIGFASAASIVVWAVIWVISFIVIKRIFGKAST